MISEMCGTGDGESATATGMMAEEQRCFLRVVRGEESVPRTRLTLARSRLRTAIGSSVSCTDSGPGAGVHVGVRAREVERKKR